MKLKLNEMYMRPIPYEFSLHILNDLGFKDEDKKIINSLMNHLGNSTFHYDNTMIPRERFEYRLKIINDCIFNEIMRLAIIGFNTEKELKHKQNTNKTQ